MIVFRSSNCLPITGRLGAHIHGHFYNRDVHQDFGAGIHTAQEQLHAQPLEHYGLCRRCLGVFMHIHKSCSY